MSGHETTIDPLSAHAQLESEYETIVSLKNAPYFATCVCLRLVVRSRMLPRKNTVRNIVLSK